MENNFRIKGGFTIEKVDHIGVAVRNLERAIEFYSNVFNLKVKKIECHDEINVKICFIPIGDVMLELIEPIGSKSRIANFLNEKGDGIHHIAFRVKDIRKALEKLSNKKIKLRDEHPRPGGARSQIAFIDPEDTNNVLIELVEREEDI